MKRLAIALVTLALASAGGAPGVSASNPSKEPARAAAPCRYNCTVYVKGYTRKNGTYVSPYRRSPPRR